MSKVILVSKVTPVCSIINYVHVWLIIGTQIMMLSNELLLFLIYSSASSEDRGDFHGVFIRLLVFQPVNLQECVLNSSKKSLEIQI